METATGTVEPAAPEAPVLYALTIACVGWRITDKNDLKQFWLMPDDREVCFSGKKPIPLARPGGLFGVKYQVNADNSRSYHLGEARYVGNYHDPKKILQWQTESRAAEAIVANKKEAKKEQRDRLKEVLAPVRELYRKTIDPAQKAAILAAVIEAVTR